MPQALPFIYLAVAAAGTVVAVQGANTQSRQLDANAKFQSAQAAADAKAEQGAATIEAERIQKAAKMQRAQAVAAAAASGVDVNSPTAVKIDQTIENNANQDAYLTMVGGNDQAARLKQGGDAALINGQSQAAAARAQGTSALLQFGATATNYGNGWKRAGT